tara:strand:+ start:2480 stop:3997 length:1518 start_codon:yes stop_codon:yes gene_type:complete
MNFFILLIVFSFSFSLELNDTLSFEKDTISNDFILIPDYSKKHNDFKIEYLHKKRKFFYEFSVGYLNDYQSINTGLSTKISTRQLKFKFDFEYYSNLEQNSEIDNNYTVMSLIGMIDYLDLSFKNDNLNLYFGKINQITFGYGYLLNRYSNNLSYPFTKNSGLQFSFNNSNKTIKFNSFISNIDNFIDKGGLLGNHFSFIISSNFPLRIGFGHVIDFDQFVNFNEQIQYNRQINGYELDFDFPLFNLFKKNVMLFGEFTAVKFPETRYYKRVDDNEFTNDKKSRNGVWGMFFPGLRYTRNDSKIMFGLNFNSSIFNPKYFNNTYDFEKVRFRQYNIDSNEQNFSDEANLLMTFANDTVNQTGVYIPKDLLGMINSFENTYPTYGLSLNFEKKIAEKGYFSFDFSHYKENNLNSNLFYNDVYFSLKDKKNIFSIPTEYQIVISKTFFESNSISKLEENLFYGLTANLNIYKNYSLIIDYKNCFYDVDFDGVIDEHLYFMSKIKIKF